MLQITAKTFITAEQLQLNHWWTTALQLHSTTETLHLFKPNKSAKSLQEFNYILQKNYQQHTCKLNRKN
jgi:hypothetical protein